MSKQATDLPYCALVGCVRRFRTREQVLHHKASFAPVILGVNPTHGRSPRGVSLGSAGPCLDNLCPAAIVKDAPTSTGPSGRQDCRRFRGPEVGQEVEGEGLPSRFAADLGRKREREGALR